MSPWIPRPVSFLRTFVLMFIVGLTGQLLRMFGREIITAQNERLIVALFIGLSLLPFIAYAYIHSWLLGKKAESHSKKLPAINSIKEAVLAFVVTVLSLLFTFAILIVFMPRGGNSYLYTQDGYAEISIWIISVLCLFHAYDAIARPKKA
ncbi:hypothetical protein TUMEXPCC7403_16960 [Tumidithrix helvetica PCC 7403]|uniref:hypothetical protein n=1 Tax=Tumidithrix helvetica TaxID=3457545 RepID=UPI003CAFB001